MVLQTPLSVSPIKAAKGLLDVKMQQDKTARAKADCEAKGGRWDGQTCIMPSKETTTPQVNPPKVNDKGFVVKTDQNNEVVGFEKNGSTFYRPPGISDEEWFGNIETLAAKEARKTAIPQGATVSGTAQAQANQQAKIAQLTQMAQQGLLTPEELQSIAGAPLDIGQTLGAGAVGILPGAIGGALTGATAGLIAGAPTGPGALITAGLGAVTGFLVAARSNIKSQTAGEFSADQAALSKGERMLRSLITDTNQNPQNAGENIALFYQTLNLIDAAHAKTWKDSQESLNRFLGNDGTPQLAKFDTFDSTMRYYYLNQFEAALASPDPSRMLITMEDLEVGLE